MRVRVFALDDGPAGLIAIRVNWGWRRNVPAVEMADRKSHSGWKEFCAKLKSRGLNGVELVISDDLAGLGKAIGEAVQQPATCISTIHVGLPGAEGRQ